MTSTMPRAVTSCEPCRYGDRHQRRAWAELNDPDAPEWLRYLAPGGHGSEWARSEGECVVPYVAREPDLTWCGERR